MVYALIRKICLLSLSAAVLVIPCVPAGAVLAAPVAEWTQTSQPDFAGGMLANLDIDTGPGDVKLAKTGSEQWSDMYQDILVKTSLLTPATAPTTTGGVAVGGKVYSVNKETIMAPLPAFAALAVVFALGVFIILEVIHARRLPRYIRYRRTRLKLK